MSCKKSAWTGAIREWCAYEITTDLLWCRWDVIGINRRGDFVQFHFFDRAPNRRAAAGMRKRVIADMKRFARERGIAPISGALELPEGAHRARFL
jgi:hypothetical protein